MQHIRVQSLSLIILYSPRYLFYQINESNFTCCFYTLISEPNLWIVQHVKAFVIFTVLSNFHFPALRREANLTTFALSGAI